MDFFDSSLSILLFSFPSESECALEMTSIEPIWKTNFSLNRVNTLLLSQLSVNSLCQIAYNFLGNIFGQQATDEILRDVLLPILNTTNATVSQLRVPFTLSLLTHFRGIHHVYAV